MDYETLLIASDQAGLIVFDFKEFINSIDALSSVKEILTFLNEYKKEHPNMLNPTLMEEIENMLSLERIYGNMKKSAVDKICDFYHTHNQL